MKILPMMDGSIITQEQSEIRDNNYKHLKVGDEIEIISTGQHYIVSKIPVDYYCYAYHKHDTEKQNLTFDMWAFEIVPQ